MTFMYFVEGSCSSIILLRDNFYCGQRVDFLFDQTTNMDDFNVGSLHESKNAWTLRLVNVLTQPILDGMKSILEEAVKSSQTTGEIDKYLLVFQTFLTQIPKWNPSIIETERKRIADKSSCAYLEELITAVHIAQLKLLSAVRVGSKHKKIDIQIPNVGDFIHKTYINVARKAHKNAYLFTLGISSLEIQKHNRELELIVRECIINTVQESIPFESLLRSYMEETVETVDEVVADPKPEPKPEPKTIEPEITTAEPEHKPSIPLTKGGLRFNDIDKAITADGVEEMLTVSKNVEDIESRYAARPPFESVAEDTDTDANAEPLVIGEVSDIIPDLEFDNVEELF